MTGGFKDSISSGDSHYNNPYSNDPGIMRGYSVRRAVIYRSADTLETQQQRLERQVETRFLQNQQIPSGKIVIIAQVGKYAVLAFVLPPYYLLYEGPKWIFIQIEPLLWLAIEKSGDLLLMLSTFAIDFWAGIGKKLQFYQKPKKILKERLLGFQQRIALGGQRFLAAWNKRLLPLKNFIAYIQGLSIKAQKEKSALVERLRKFPRQLQILLQEKRPRIEKYLQEKAVLAQEKLMTSFREIGQRMTKISWPFISFAKKLVSRASTPLSRAAHYTFKILSAFASQLNRVAKETINPLFKKNRERLLRPLEKAKNVVKLRAISAYAQAEKRIQPIFKAIQTVAIAGMLPIQRSCTLLQVMAGKGAWRFMEKVQSAAAALKRFQTAANRLFIFVFDEGKRQAKKGYEKIQKSVDALLKKMAAAWILAVDKLSNFPDLMAKFLHKLIAVLLKAFRRTVWTCRLIWAWTKVLVRYSLNQIWS